MNEEIYDLISHIPLYGELDEKNLIIAARYRVMSSDEVAERRAYMRKFLLKTNFCNLSNAQLDKCRVLTMDSIPLFDDDEGRTFALTSCAKLTDESTTFRRVRAKIPFEYMDKFIRAFDWRFYVGMNTVDQQGIINKFVAHFEEFRVKGMGLYIYSKTKGSGKTMLSCCILNELSNRYPVSVKFINILDLLEETKNSFKGTDDVLKSLYEASVLVIDDIGVQMKKEWIDMVLFKLINTRYNGHLPTIYTSNVELIQLKLDERITDRITSNCIEVHIPETPVRSIVKSAEKKKFIEKLEKAPEGTNNTSHDNAIHQPNIKPIAPVL